MATSNNRDNQKEIFVARTGCNTELGNDLTSLINFANDFESSVQLYQANQVVENLQSKNNYAECGLW